MVTEIKTVDTSGAGNWPGRAEGNFWDDNWGDGYIIRWTILRYIHFTVFKLLFNQKKKLKTRKWLKSDKHRRWAKKIQLT